METKIAEAQSWQHYQRADVIYPASLFSVGTVTYVVRTNAAAALFTVATDAERASLKAASDVFGARAVDVPGLVNAPRPDSTHAFADLVRFARINKRPDGVVKCTVHGVPCDRWKLSEILRHVDAANVFVGPLKVEAHDTPSSNHPNNAIIIEAADAGNWWRIVLMAVRVFGTGRAGKAFPNV